MLVYIMNYIHLFFALKYDGQQPKATRTRGSRCGVSTIDIDTRLFSRENRKDLARGTDYRANVVALIADK